MELAWPSMFYFLVELNVAKRFICPGIPDELVASEVILSDRAVHGGHIRLQLDMQLEQISNPS